MYETNASNAPRITNLDTAYGEADGYGGPEGTLRHGKTMNGDPFDSFETHPVAGSFQVSALDDSQTNPYDGIGNINFAFDQNTTIEESTGTPFIKVNC